MENQMQQQELKQELYKLLDENIILDTKFMINGDGMTIMLTLIPNEKGVNDDSQL